MLKTLVAILTFAVAALHLWFLVLEMFFWTKPLGLKIFRNTPERAAASVVLASNQGLYNGFLAVGLLMSFFFADPAVASAFRTYILGCVTVAGIYGAWTVHPRVFYVQALPAILALALSYCAPI